MYLYIHIPYCYKKCDYCDFFSVPSDKDIPDEYIKALLSELTFRKNQFKFQNLDSIYIGGGTPSLLKVDQISYLMSGIKETFSIADNAEVTIEMNPESLTRDKLLVSQESGINRLSLGIQSLVQNALNKVNRHCSAIQAENAINIVKQNWSGILSFDAIAGLPGQTEEQYFDTLKKLISYNPEHFSLYTLTIEEGTPLGKSISEGEEWDFDNADKMWILGRDILESNGYLQYEVSNFAKKGYESIHNNAYWHQKNYIGIGPGAYGTVYSYTNEGLRISNTKNIESYIRFWSDKQSINSYTKLPEERESLSIQTEEFEYLMMGLRTLEGITDTDYRYRFNKCGPWYGDLEQRLTKSSTRWNEFVQKGYAKVYNSIHNQNVYRLTKDGILYLNILLRDLI